MYQIKYLDAEIQKVAPIHGISIGKWTDRATWRIDFKDEATDEERSAAWALLAVLDPRDAPAPPTRAALLQQLEMAASLSDVKAAVKQLFGA